jgi:hypothetical protein
MRRRTFLGLATGGVAASVALGAKVFGIGTRIVRYREPRLDKNYPTGKLSEMEMATAIGLAEVLIPTERKSEQTNNTLRSHIDARTANERGYLKEYRSAVVLLDDTIQDVLGAKRKFFELAMSDRQQILEAILWQHRGAQTRMQQIEAIFLPARNLAFREFVVEDILEGFFRQIPAEGWAIVGYSHYPGVPTDPRAYSRPLPVTPTSNLNNHGFS